MPYHTPVVVKPAVKTRTSKAMSKINNDRMHIISRFCNRICMENDIKDFTGLTYFLEDFLNAPVPFNWDKASHDPRFNTLPYHIVHSLVEDIQIELIRLVAEEFKV